jgi:hypothetical protein
MAVCLASFLPLFDCRPRFRSRLARRFVVLSSLLLTMMMMMKMTMMMMTMTAEAFFRLELAKNADFFACRLTSNRFPPRREIGFPVKTASSFFLSTRAIFWPFGSISPELILRRGLDYL